MTFNGSHNRSGSVDILMDEVHYTEFENPNFDAKKLVQKYRLTIPLPQLQKSLHAHHATTRQELVELINEKYADFVSLSSRMQGVERALKPLKAPLEESYELTQGLHNKLGALLGQAEEAHAGLGRIRARKEALKTYLETAKLLEKVKKTSGQRRGNPQESEDFSREYIVHENVARDLRRIKLNLGGNVCLPPPPPAADVSGADQGEAFPEGQALLAEAESFQQTFAARLQERLRALVTAAQRCWEEQPPAPDGTPAASTQPTRSEMLAIAHTCRALCIIGQSASVEAIFTAVCVKGVLQKATLSCNNAAEEAKKKAMSETTDGGARVVGAGAVDLGVFFQSARKALLSEGAAMLWLTRQLRGEADDGALLAVPSLFLVSNAVVLPVLQHVQEVWPNVFMPAFPDTFAANYGHFTEFLKAAEAFMPEGELQALTRAQGLADFQRRWKTQVYCSLRAKEASQKLEAAAKRLKTCSNEPATKIHEAGGHGYRLEVSAEVVTLIDTVWNRWYLSSLYPKMARLCLELLARYGKCLKDLVEEAPAGGPGWDSSAASPSWAASSVPVRLSRAASDLLQVLSELEASEKTGYLAGVFLERLPSKDAKPAELAKALLKEAAEGLHPTVHVLKDAMLKQIVAVTAPQFAPIRNIPAFYRMLNKPVPTKASTYVEAALRPLQAFREVIVDAAIQSPKVVEEWLREAVDGAAAEFTVQATQLLESTAQQEASLRRLAGRGAGGEAQVSDLDKIHMQLCLDVDTFCSAASALGSDVGSAPGLAKLMQAVAAVRPASLSQ